ncbi:MAG: hypothetical protein AAGA29_05750 [Planctomycetota bacterium]
MSLINHAYQTTDPAFKLDGSPLFTDRVLALGDQRWQPGMYATRVRLLDREKVERTYGLFVVAESQEAAQAICDERGLGEVVTGEVVVSGQRSAA